MSSNFNLKINGPTKVTNSVLVTITSNTGVLNFELLKFPLAYI